MHAHHTGSANPMQQVLTQAERLAREQQGNRIGLVFQGITAISLGAMTLMSLRDVIREIRKSNRGPTGHGHP